jgi:hypothetical protein
MAKISVALINVIHLDFLPHEVNEHTKIETSFTPIPGKRVQSPSNDSLRIRIGTRGKNNNKDSFSYITEQDFLILIDYALPHRNPQRLRGLFQKRQRGFGRT